MGQKHVCQQDGQPGDEIFELGMSREGYNDLQSELRGQINVGVFYRPPDQKEVDRDFCRQLEAASHLQALVFKGD